MSNTEQSKYNTLEFTQGMQDCKSGVPHKSGNTESYDAGYGSQYQLEQLNNNVKGMKL